MKDDITYLAASLAVLSERKMDWLVNAEIMHGGKVSVHVSDDAFIEAFGDAPHTVRSTSSGKFDKLEIKEDGVSIYCLAPLGPVYRKVGNEYVEVTNA